MQGRAQGQVAHGSVPGLPFGVPVLAAIIGVAAALVSGNDAIQWSVAAGVGRS